MSDRIAVLNNGKVEQIADPNNLYENPSNEFVADFIGESNFIEGEFYGKEEGFDLIRIKEGILIKVPRRQDYYQKGPIKLVVRPEKIFFVDLGDEKEGVNIIEGVIDEIVYIGEVTKFRLKTSLAIDLELKQQNRLGIKKYQIGDRVRVGWKIEDTRIL
jgi:ABC-type Fe3+/spermidine/putrescine transport system ATPase subunit